MSHLTPVYAPLQLFLDRVVNHGRQMIANKTFIRRDLFSAETERLRTALYADLASHARERAQALELLHAVDAMNRPHWLLHDSVWLNLDQFYTVLDQIQSLIPDEKLIPGEEYEKLSQKHLS